MTMRALGNIIDVHSGLVSDWASGQTSPRVSLRDASGVTFLAVAASASNTPDLTIEQHNAPSGGDTKPVVIPANHTYFRKQHGSIVPGTWTEVAVDPSDAAVGEIDDIFSSANGGIVSVYIDVSWLDVNGGFTYVTADIDSGISGARQGILVAVLHGLATKRAPQNLRSVTA